MKVCKMFKSFLSILYKIIKKSKVRMVYKFEYFYYKMIYRRPNIKKAFRVNRFITGGSEDLSELVVNYTKYFSSKVSDKIKQADLICDRTFNFLGSGPISLKSENLYYQLIDWHCDFKSGFKWNPETFFRYIKYGHKEGVDIKVPWELSYSHHLILLGQVYLLTENSKYSEEFRKEIEDWVDNNKVGFGVGWACPMIVSIRAANWLVAMEYFSGKEVFPQQFLDKFFVSIYEHGKFIRRHLEYTRYFTYNHYIANIVGLFFIAVYCPFFNESKKWQSFALKELSKEIEKQVYPDGCSFEASTSYHRLVLELFFYTELLGKRAGIKFPKHYKDKVKKMFEFSLYSIKPNGMIPQIGDNDSGRFFIFTTRSVLEHKYLLSLAAIYYSDSQFKLPEFAFDEEAFWIFGKNVRELYDNIPFRKEPLNSRAFPDAGWYIMRHNRDYCFVSCGPNGQGGNGGHAHNDKLSFELMLDGLDIFVDPGTYVYTPYPGERNKFRSTEYHNTIKFDNYEQNEIFDKDIFSLPNRVKIKDADLKETDDKITFQRKIQYPDFTHKRIINYDKKDHDWQITDNISCLEPVKAKLIFHLSPDVYYYNSSIFLRKTDKKIGSIEIEGYKLKKGEYDYSPEYGIKMKAEYLVANISATKDVKTINTYIYKR